MVETADTRAANRSSVLACLLAYGRCSRRELSGATGLSPATVSRVVDGLLEDGLVREGAPVETGKRGRQAVLLEAAAERGLACGIDLGGTTCRLLATDLIGGNPRYSEQPTPSELSATELADWLAELVNGIGTGTETERVAVFGLPGAVAEDGATVRGATNLPQINGSEFTTRLRESLDDAVRFDNDANLALEGELRHGAASTAEHAAMFTIGRGFGAGVALERRVLGSRTGLVGEFGFLPFEQGSVEDAVSAPGLLAAAREAGAEVSDPAELFTSTKYRHREVLGRFERALSLALTATTLAYEPELVVLGGRVSDSIDEAMRARIAEGVQLPDTPELVAPKLGDRAGAIGAVARALIVSHTRFGVAAETAAGLSSGLDVDSLLDEEGKTCS